MVRRADIVIIGGGPGGYVAALRGAQLGARAVLIERDRLGGTCLNRGCIPTKALLEVARTLGALRRARDMGVKAAGVSVDLPQVRRHRDRAVRTLATGVRHLLASAGVEVLAGHGVLRGPSTVAVAGPGGSAEELLEAGAVILATGSVPAPPLCQGFWDSDAALAVEAVPESLAIIGGGPVGLELAVIYHALGSRVTVIEMAPRVLPREDGEVGEELARVLERRGIRILTGTRVRAAEKLSDGGFVLRTEGVGGEASLAAAAVLSAVGRRPACEGLGLEVVGLPAGWIAVDERMATAVPGLYAVGDVNGRSLLAHAASAQGIVAVEAVLGRAPSVDLSLIPSCTYTWPEAASVGLTEEAARSAGADVAVGRFPFSANGRAAAAAEREGFVKVVVEKSTGRLLGVHILGPHASTMIHEACLALATRATLADVERTVHAHPTFSEAFAEACLGAQGRALHLPPEPAHNTASVAPSSKTGTAE